MRRRKSKAKPRPAPTAAGLLKRDGEGRVHLTLQHEASTGTTALSLNHPLFHEPWQNDLALSAAGSAWTSFSQGVTSAHGVQLARQAMAATSKLADGLVAQAHNGKVACRPGCAHCCYQTVGVTPVEALAIAEHLRRSCTAEQLAQVAAELAHFLARTRNLTSAERYSPELPCPFLKQARCSIYEARPLSCRGMNALDEHECDTQLHDPVARNAYLKTGVGGRSFLEPLRAVQAVSAGLQLGLSELFQLDMRPVELVSAVHELLTCPDAEQAWLARAPAFDHARRASSADSAPLRALSGSVPSSPRRP